MKLIIKLWGVLLCGLMIAACSGSDAYQGEWSATDNSGNEFVINFEPKSLMITDASGQTEESGYTQRRISTVNGVSTYGIQLSGGDEYEITFPDPKNDNRALFIRSATESSFGGFLTITESESLMFTLTR